MKRHLGPWSTVLLMVANMVGAGVFTTSGFALEALGDPAYVLLAWVVGGLLALAGALNYIALGLAFKQSGGEYLILSRAIHPLAGFMAGWVSLLAGFTAPIAASAHALESYLGFSGARSIGCAVILVFGSLHALHLRGGVWLQNAAVLLKTSIFVVFLIAVISAGITPTDQAPVAFTGWGAFGITLLWVSFAYTGWNAPIYLMGELRQSGRSLSRSVVFGLGGVILLYLALNTAFLYGPPRQMIVGQAEVGRIAAAYFGGPLLELTLTSLVVIALVTSISSMLMTGPRVYAQMAEDGLFPAFFAFRGKSPLAAVCLQTGLALVAFLLGDLRDLMTYIGYVLSLSSGVTVAVVFFYRDQSGRRLKVPGFPWTTGCFVGASFMMTVVLITMKPGQALLGLVTLLAGIPIYLFYRRGPRMVSNDSGADGERPD